MAANYCRRCGVKLFPGNRVCSNCGQTLYDVPSAPEERDIWAPLHRMNDHDLIMSEAHSLRLIVKELRETRSLMTYGFVAIGFLLIIALGWMFFILFHLTRFVLAP